MLAFHMAIQVGRLGTTVITITALPNVSKLNHFRFYLSVHTYNKFIGIESVWWVNSQYPWVIWVNLCFVLMCVLRAFLVFIVSWHCSH